MHEDDKASGESSPPLAASPADSMLTAGTPEGQALPVDSPVFPAEAGPRRRLTGLAAVPRGLIGRYRKVVPRRVRGMLAYLMVAVVAAAGGVGTTLVVRGGGFGALCANGMAGAQAAMMNDEAVYNKVEPGIVDVDANLQYLEETAEGTGFVINAAAGLILTNNHVIDGATSVTVTPVASGQTYTARVLGYDQSADVALLQLTGVADLKAVKIGDSSQVAAGTPVLAIGNEAGQGGSPTVAPGVISSLDRTIEASDQSSGLTEVLHDMLQTNANIRPGDSGGPLANAAGQVIGIDTAAGGSTVYSGYAIPIDQALAIAKQIADKHATSTIQIGLPAFLGVLVPDSSSSDPQRQASQEQKHSGNINNSGSLSGGGNVTGGDCTTGDAAMVPANIAPARSGALVDGVLCGTVAATVGLYAGDVITSIGGRPVTTPASLNAIVARYRPGGEPKVTWISPDGVWHSAVITLSAGPAG